MNKKSGFLYKHNDPRELAKILNAVIQLDQDALNSLVMKVEKHCKNMMWNQCAIQL